MINIINIALLIAIISIPKVSFCEVVGFMDGIDGYKFGEKINPVEKGYKKDVNSYRKGNIKINTIDGRMFIYFIINDSKDCNLIEQISSRYGNPKYYKDGGKYGNEIKDRYEWNIDYYNNINYYNDNFTYDNKYILSVYNKKVPEEYHNKRVIKSNSKIDNIKQIKTKIIDVYTPEGIIAILTGSGYYTTDYNINGLNGNRMHKELINLSNNKNDVIISYIVGSNGNFYMKNLKEIPNKISYKIQESDTKKEITATITGYQLTTDYDFVKTTKGEYTLSSIDNKNYKKHREYIQKNIGKIVTFTLENEFIKNIIIK